MNADQCKRPLFICVHPRSSAVPSPSCWCKAPCYHSRPRQHASWGSRMMNALRQLDRILRGDATRLSELRGGGIQVPALGLSGILIALGLFYGACMGTFAITGSG